MTLTKQSRTRLEQKSIAFAAAYLVSFLAILSCTNALTNVIGINTSLDTVVLYGLLWGGLLLALWSILRTAYVKLDVLLVFLFLGVSYLITAVAFPQNIRFLYTSLLDYAQNPFYVVWLYSLPGYLLARHLHDYEQFSSYLYKLSYIVVILSVWTYFFSGESDANQYMTLSYNMLLQLVFLIYHKPKRWKLLHYVVIAAGVFVVAFGGARGALLGLLVAVFLLLMSKNSTVKNKAVYMVVFLACAVLFWLFFDEIIRFLIKLLNGMDISSRTLELLLQDGGFSSVVRTKIYSLALQNINLLGRGLYGDRVMMQGMDDSYVHNLFLEFLIDYGVILGGVLSVVVVWVLIRALKRASPALWRLIAIFIPNGFVALMLTGSYLNQAPAFYVLMGLCVNVITERKPRYEGVADQHGIPEGKHGENCQKPA